MHRGGGYLKNNKVSQASSCKADVLTTDIDTKIEAGIYRQPDRDTHSRDTGRQLTGRLVVTKQIDQRVGSSNN